MRARAEKERVMEMDAGEKERAKAAMARAMEGTPVMMAAKVFALSLLQSSSVKSVAIFKKKRSVLFARCAIHIHPFQ
jgi:hypothetical protein